MKVFFVFALFVQLFAATTVHGARPFNCPAGDVKFEKVIGLRPSANINRLLLYQTREPYYPITKVCLNKCQSNRDCAGFVVYYNVSTCYWHRSTPVGEQEINNIVDFNTAWFIKQCYNGSSCAKLWLFERVPGATLIGNNTKRLPQPLTRLECQQRCLAEPDFECRSAKFRLAPAAYGRQHDQVVGICTLSDADRHGAPNAYRVSGFDDEYFENECVALVTNKPNEFCAYEEYQNASFTHSDAVLFNKSKDECETACERHAEFNCRGFSLIFVNGNEQEFDCMLHSEDTKVHGPRFLLESPFGRYYERAQCINISLSCTETYMTVSYQPEANFKGRLYMQGFSDQQQCYAQGNNFNVVTLKLPLLSQQCGIIKAKAPNNRTLMTGTMVLQYNPVIQTQGDRAIRVGCIYGNDSKVLVGTGIQISTVPNQGTTILNATGSVGNPTVTMYILDLNTNEEVSSTQIGQELQLLIDVKPPNGPFDIWAGHLVAMTEDSSESIILLDDRGCPTNINIFPQLEKIRTNETHRLASNFQAFKFSSSPIVRFSVIVQFCTEKCAPVVCREAGGRRRRAIERKTIQTANGTTVVTVNRTEFALSSPNGRMMPLEFVMIVRDGTTQSDKLVVSDGKVLVAGYDYRTNEVCIDYSLFVGMILTFVIIQVVFVVASVVLIRRYKLQYEKDATRQSMEELHKNFGAFGHMDQNRRVHWAENNSQLT